MYKPIQWICAIYVLYVHMDGNKTLYHLVNLTKQNLEMVWSGLRTVAWDMRQNYQHVPQTVNPNNSAPNILKPNNSMPHISKPPKIFIPHIVIQNISMSQNKIEIPFQPWIVLNSFEVALLLL